MIRRSDTLLLNEAVMSADDLVHESGSTDPRAADIEAVSLNSGSHHDDGDLDDRSGIHSLDIEAVAQLARFYAVGAPPDEELRSIKEWINASGDELPDKQKCARPTPKVSATAREAWSYQAAFDLRVADDSFDRTATIRDASDDFASARASAIRPGPRQSGFKNRFVSARALTRGQISHVALFFFAAAIGLAILWHSFEAKEIVTRWVLSLDRSLSISTKRSPPELATSSELLRRAAVPPEITAALHSAKRNDAQQERMYADGAAGLKQSTRLKRSVRPQDKRIPMPVPETRVTTIEGWMLREVTNGAAVLEGPNGIWTARQGDIVPGVGRVDSIVRWGKRWIVATSGGLISTP